MTDEPKGIFDQPTMSPLVGGDINVAAEKQRELERLEEAKKATQKASEEADAKKGDEAARSNKPLVGGPLVGQKSTVNPAMESGPAYVKPIDGPIVHGEASQRFVNKNAAHSERVLHGNVVTPPKRKERYEHPERKA